MALCVKAKRRFRHSIQISVSHPNDTNQTRTDASALSPAGSPSHPMPAASAAPASGSTHPVSPATPLLEKDGWRATRRRALREPQVEVR